MASGGARDGDIIHTGSALLALGMIATGALGLLGVLSPSPWLIAILLVVIILLSFSIGKRWEARRTREETASADYKRA